MYIRFRSYNSNQALTSNRIIRSESDVHYIYYVLLPGLDKSNLDIEQIKEKDFLTIIITLVNTVHVNSNDISNSLFPQEPLKLIKLAENVNFKEEIIMNMSKGLLLVKIPKKYPTKRKKLKI